MNPSPTKQDIADLVKQLDLEQMIRVFAYLEQLTSEDAD